MMLHIWLDIPGLERAAAVESRWTKVPDNVGMYHVPGYGRQTHAIVWIDDHDGGAWFIIMMHVHPDLRGQGLGRRMLDCIIAATDAQGANLKLTVEPIAPVGLDYAQLAAFYQRAGFVFDPQYNGYLMRRTPRLGGE